VSPQVCLTARPGRPADLVILRDLAVSHANEIVAQVAVSEQKDMLTQGAVGDLGEITRLSETPAKALWTSNITSAEAPRRGPVYHPWSIVTFGAVLRLRNPTNPSRPMLVGGKAPRGRLP